MQNYSDSIIKTTELIKEADYILVGAGAGFSAAGGVDYSDSEFLKSGFLSLQHLV
ncbi:MAG: hypothetical protein K0R31_2366 [Clostridiales bacterium]|jgi:hypothetical protein|nr:hypothetical protein [Clostridiales bacterium]